MKFQLFTHWVASKSARKSLKLCQLPLWRARLVHTRGPTSSPHFHVVFEKIKSFPLLSLSHSQLNWWCVVQIVSGSFPPCALVEKIVPRPSPCGCATRDVYVRNSRMKHSLDYFFLSLFSVCSVLCALWVDMNATYADGMEYTTTQVSSGGWM